MAKRKAKAAKINITPEMSEGLDRAMRHLIKNWSDAPRLDALAEVAGSSLFHFLRCFKTKFGKTPRTILTERQISEAKIMLVKEVPIPEVARRCGFAHHGHFTARMKAITGMTPSQFVAKNSK